VTLLVFSIEFYVPNIEHIKMASWKFTFFFEIKDMVFCDHGSTLIGDVFMIVKVCK